MTLAQVLYKASGDKAIYYAESLKLDAWSLSQAVLIVSGNIDFNDIPIEEACNRFPLLVQLRNLAIDACLGDVLKAKQVGKTFYVRPKDFLQWLLNKKWEFPPELIQEMKKKQWHFHCPRKPRKDTRDFHKNQVQELGEKIAKKLNKFNQKQIYGDEEMQTLLKGFIDDFRRPRIYSETAIKRWLSEIDPRPINERRGGPVRQKK